ncbi:MAG: glycosyltransferase family 2 protein [Promethearchaeota archaeon]
MFNKTLIIMIPAFNEKNYIANLIKNIPQIHNIKQEIIVINDGSLDNTSLIAKNAGAKVITHQRNLGLGEAIKTGLNYCLKHKADVIAILDADGQYNPKKIECLILPILNNKADLVIGNRFKYRTINETNFMKKLGNKILSIFISKILLSLDKTYDIQCSFRAFNRKLCKILSKLLFGKYNYAQEMFILVKLFGFNVKEIPVDCYRRNNGRSRLIRNPLIHIFRILGISFRTYFKMKFILKNC